MAAAGGTQTRPSAAAATTSPPPPHTHHHRKHHQHNNPQPRPSYTANHIPNSSKYAKEGDVRDEAQDRMAPTIMQSDDYLSPMPPLAAEYCSGGGGSALFKSMKYAETWLNLTVADRGAHRPRPKLLINDPQRPPFFLPANLCTCPDSGRNTKSKKPTCSKCKGQRIRFNPDQKKRTPDQFYSVRIPRQTVSRNPIFRYDVDFFEDPYSVMRRCRLQSPPNDKTVEKPKKCRAKSSSPPSRRKRKPDAPLKGNRCPSPDEISRFDDYVKQKEKENLILNGGAGRRSILDCGVNAYELIRLKNGGSDKANDSSRNKSSSKFNTLTSTLNKNKLINSLLNRKPINDEVKKVSSPLGVKIAGQRMNIFDESKPRIEPVVDHIDEFVYESDQTNDSYELVCFNGYQSQERSQPVRNGYQSTQDRLSPTRNGYQNSQDRPARSGYQNSQDRLSPTRNEYQNKQDNLSPTRNGHQNSQDRLSPVRNGYQNCQDRLSPVRNGYQSNQERQSTQDRLPSVRNGYQNSQDTLSPVRSGHQSNLDRHHSSQDRFPSVRNGYQNSQDRLSPVRPPRKTKGQFDEGDSSNLEAIPSPPPAPPEPEALIVPKNRVNFDLNIDAFNKNNTLTSSTSLEIKSILKKPPNFNSLFNFNNISLENTTQESYYDKTSRKEAIRINPDCSEVNGNSKTAYQPTVIVLDGNCASQNDSKLASVNKKKKQVQFKVNRVEVIPGDLEETAERAAAFKRVDVQEQPMRNESTTSQATEVDQSGNDRTSRNESVEDVSRSRIVINSKSHNITSEVKTCAVDVPASGGPTTSTPPAKRLHRSLSERIATSPPNDNQSFNDTMRLNLRMGRRGDSRSMFAIDENDPSPHHRVISPNRSRPKEPPPPPPPLRALSPPKPPPRLIFPFAKKSPDVTESKDSDYHNSQLIYIENNYIDFVCGKGSDSQSKIKLEVRGDGEKMDQSEDDKSDEEGQKECSTVSIVPIESSPRKVSTVIINGDDDDRSPVIGDSSANKVTISVGDFKRSETSFYQNSIQIGDCSAPCDTEPEAKAAPSRNSSRLEEIVEEKETPEVEASNAENLMNSLIRRNYDPVLAMRQNLIPHICGKASESSGEKYPEESSWESSANSSAPPTPSTVSVCSDKPEIFYSSKNIISDTPNHYESVCDPIYEEISDIPPPLPLSPPPPLTTLEAIIDDNIPTRSIFEGASKYDILSYLVDAKQRCIATAEEPEYVIEESIMNQTIMEEESEATTPAHSRINSLDLSCSRHSQASCSDSSEDSGNMMCSSNNSSIRHTEKVRKSCAEIERNDSGVGSETSQCSRSKWQHLSPDTFREDQQHICEDCDQPVETQVSDSGLMFAPLVCRKCSKRRAERREIIAEIVETEEKYGRDLHIILEEFYRPMLVAGLLTPEQLTFIFLNVEELLENNVILAEKLRDALEIAVEQGDEDLLTVNIGRIFLETTSMLHAFESYCTKQGAAAMMLANLEKEKELLRIFLRVSQMENSVLRRMNLNSFLMVPVQRVTKYPLLLARLYKVTPPHHTGRELLREAQHKIELHLEHMNSLAKDIGSTKLWRRISIINGRRSNSETDMITIKLRKIAVDVLDWTHEDVRFAIEGRLLFTQPTDHNWRKGRTIKLSPINAMVVTLGKPTENYHPESEEILTFPRNHGIKEATLLLLKEKSGRFALLREPLFLDRCIVCTDSEWEEYFEVQELVTKDTYIFKAEDSEKTKLWYRQVQYHAQGLGQWRKRRNALANIMINGMQLRS